MKRPSTKTIIIAVASLAVIALLIALIAKKDRTKTVPDIPPQKTGSSGTGSELPEAASEMKKQLDEKIAAIKDSLFQQTETTEQSKKTILDDGQKIKDSSAPKTKSVYDRINSYYQGSQSPYGAGLEQEQQTAGQNTLTDKEIFNILNPPEYIDVIAFFQDQLVVAGFIKEEERLPLNSEENLIAIQLKGLDYLLSQNFISQEEHNRWKTFLSGGYQQFRQMEADSVKQEYMQGTLQLKAPPTKKYKTVKNDETGGPLNKIAGFVSFMGKFGFHDTLKTAFKILVSKKVLAQPVYLPAGNWISPPRGVPPDCFKDIVPASPIPGINAFAPCCNCGLFCAKGCIFIFDCGPYSIFCNVPLGCLNAICRSYPNAIYDITTGLCACG